jgi:hypothetical protein
MLNYDKVMARKSNTYYLADTVPQLPGDSLSAPASIIFIDSSVNAISHFWNFNDAPEDTTYAQNPQHTYYLPDTYRIKLVVTSPEGCVDSSKEIIKVERPFIGKDTSRTPPIKLTNVFVPGSVKEPKFTLLLISVDNFQIDIYSKWGTRVHHYDGPSNNWDGWDGNTQAGLKAASGIYYYVIHATNWDPYVDPYFNSDGIYKGYLYLFRED